MPMVESCNKESIRLSSACRGLAFLMLRRRQYRIHHYHLLKHIRYGFRNPSEQRVYTRTNTRGLILSRARRMKKEPARTVDPENAIIPVYDPCPWTRRTPARGPPTNDLRRKKHQQPNITKANQKKLGVLPRAGFEDCL